jgi:hypothetical protein
MKHLPSCHQSTTEAPYRRPVTATLRLRFLSAVNRLRRRSRQTTLPRTHLVSAPKSQLGTAHLS